MDLSEIAIKIENMYEENETVENVKKFVFNKLLKNVLDESVNLEDYLLVYSGYCKVCDSNAEIFKVDIDDYENTLDYAHAIYSLYKKEKTLTYKDIFCKICARPLYEIDLFEIY
ncbi:hypothetical protein [Diatraea saccharalis granulovirus]|uniref:Uncharacterized protein n=1 Tax=Diatraea saccharalis granulovirus TaxID=1675862 RepID=A0A0R7EYX6_9BBAC|nr:hypothetical protein [Diatraea saccharalis granulovirus]AKN80786.1 hypothetical protein [Diatraea saccharalis granulovirus]